MSFLTAESRVDCGCDPSFQLPVGVDPTGNNHRITACLSCGKVEATEAAVDEPRAGDIRCHGHAVLTLPAPLMKWFEQWPRMLMKWPYDYACLPSSTRCASAAELAETSAKAWAEQSALPRGRRLRLSGVPRVPASVPLPLHLQGYGVIWEALQLPAHTDPIRLFRMAQYPSGTGPIGVDLILKRDDRVALLKEYILGSASDLRLGAFNVLLADRSLLPEVLPLLVELIERIPVFADSETRRITAWRDVEVLLEGLSSLKPASGELAEALKALSTRIGRRDYELVRRISDTVRLLKGEPVPSRAYLGMLP